MDMSGVKASENWIEYGKTLKKDTFFGQWYRPSYKWAQQ
jgi:hypothetical protein